MFSIGNALAEEVVFRGVLFAALEPVVGAGLTVLGTAVIFGWFHLHGYPPGPWGAVLAGLYGLALGWLRAVTKGIGLPVLAHIVADATIFMMVSSL